MTHSRLEGRIRAAEAEIEGEKHVTRHVLEQVRRATAEIAAMRVELTTLGLRFDNLAGTVSLAMSALTAHGAQLNILLQDVGAIRREMATRSDVAAIEIRLDQVDGRFDRVDERFGRMDERFDRVDARLDTELAAIRHDMARQHNEVLAAIRALAGNAPPPA